MTNIGICACNVSLTLFDMRCATVLCLLAIVHYASAVAPGQVCEVHNAEIGPCRTSLAEAKAQRKVADAACASANNALPADQRGKASCDAAPKKETMAAGCMWDATKASCGGGNDDICTALYTHSKCLLDISCWPESNSDQLPDEYRSDQVSSMVPFPWSRWRAGAGVPCSL